MPGFSTLGGMDISDANAGVGDVKAPKTFYSVAAPKKTGTLATVALLADNSAYPAGYHVGAANLSAVDADLDAANIKLNTTIFGKVGTLIFTAAHDIAAVVSGGSCPDVSGYLKTKLITIPAGNDVDLVSLTQTYATGAMVEAFGGLMCYELYEGYPNVLKLRLYMDGELKAESNYIGDGDVNAAFIVLIGAKALSGSKIVKIAAHNYGGASHHIIILGGYAGGSQYLGGIFAAGVKVA